MTHEAAFFLSFQQKLFRLFHDSIRVFASFDFFKQ